MPGRKPRFIREKSELYRVRKQTESVTARVKIGQGEPLSGSNATLGLVPVLGQKVGSETWFLLGSAAEVDDMTLTIATIVPELEVGDKVSITHKVHGGDEPLIIEHFYTIEDGEAGDQILLSFVDLDAI